MLRVALLRACYVWNQFFRGGALTCLLAFGLPALVQGQPLATHPALAPASTTWNQQLGKFGESFVREVYRAKGDRFTVFDLNVGEHGIDGLVREIGADGKPLYRVIEVKTLQNGTDFNLGDTKAGRQLSAGWIEERLGTAARNHADEATRIAAADALTVFRANPAKVPAELHGVFIGSDRYCVKRMNAVTGVLEDVAEQRVTGLLKELQTRSTNKDLRDAAARHLAHFDQVQAAKKPRLAVGEAFAKELSEAAGVESQAMRDALEEGSRQVVKAGQSRWVTIGGKTLRFVGKAAGPAGVVVEVVLYRNAAALIEQRYELGELTREEADKELRLQAGSSAATAGGGLAGGAAGAAIGTMLCPGVGTVAGGIIGAVGGGVATDAALAAMGLTEQFGQLLYDGANYAAETAWSGAVVVHDGAVYAAGQLTAAPGAAYTLSSDCTNWVGWQASSTWNWAWGD